MPNLYRKLTRLRAKRDRLQRRISFLENKLAGKKSRWGKCSCRKNRA